MYTNIHINILTYILLYIKIHGKGTINYCKSSNGNSNRTITLKFKDKGDTIPMQLLAV